ncbi:DUF6894 family protein [Roseomonas elaeocarpi]|uniref:DUF6894 family protein n=1 Tax=Roseomonas elaeocarpi TaxID=907779 RepID=A0ABV6JQA5_9PROT
MPLYYFDTIAASGLIRDTIGVNYPDDGTARREAIAALPNIAADELPDGDHRIFSVIVRDADQRTIYIADLTLTGRWLR